jgi:hypothetical protein
VEAEALDPPGGVPVIEGFTALSATSQPPSNARAAVKTASFPNPIMTDQNPLLRPGRAAHPSCLPVHCSFSYKNQLLYRHAPGRANSIPCPEPAIPLMPQRLGLIL